MNEQLSFFDEIDESVNETPGNESPNEESKILTAVELFQPFFLSTYVPMKQTEKRIEAIKEEMKNRLENDSRKRIEFKKYDVIAKWRVMPIYEVDYAGLNEMLYDHGLIQLISIPKKGLSKELKEELEPFKLPPEYYVVPNVNNKKAKKLIEDMEEFNVEKAETDNILLLFNRYYNINKEREEQYKKLKEEMARCRVLKKEKKLAFEYGTIGLRKKHMGYDTDNIIEFFGIDYLLAYGRPDMQALDFFIERGIIDKKEVAKFRKEIDRQLDFMLMTRESEEKQYEIYQQKLQQRIQRSMSR
jgi:hypothetical protein